MIQQLPQVLFIKVLQFVPIIELIQLTKQDNGFKIHILDPFILRQVLSFNYPQSLIPRIAPQALWSVLESLQNHQQEIPFWGIHSNSGLAYGTLRFWIGKAFMMSYKPQVGLKVLDKSYIDGVLAHNVVQFKRALTKFARQFLEFQMAEDPGVQNMSEIEILSVYSYLHKAPQFESSQSLIDYSTDMSEMIYDLIDYDPLEFRDYIHQKINYIIAYPSQVTINNNSIFQQSINTFMIFTSMMNEFPQGYNINLNCKTPQDWITYLESDDPIYKINRTNIPQLHQYCQVFDEQYQEYQYCTFIVVDPMNPSPLLWIQQSGQWIIQFKFNKNERILCKSVHVKLISGESNDDYKYDGIGFEYISFNGALIDEQSLHCVEI